MVYADKAHTALGKRLQRQRMTAGVAAIIVMGGWGIASGSAQAQPPPATPNSAPVTSPTYKIAVEDILQIEVVDRPELTKVIQVLNDGTINYPYAGQINVVGMTISSLQSKIRAAIAKQFVNPQVVISVQRKAERQITVLGEVKAPGKHILRNDNYRVLDALADSGGLTGDRPEFFNAQLTRVKAGEVLTVDLGKLLNGNDADQNYKMEQDDVLYITSKEAATVQVQVVGQMTRPGPLVLPRSGSLVEVLQLTGPPLPNAALSQARIERGGANIPLDLRDFYRTGKLETTEKLEPGDRLVIPENKKIVKVVGAAGRTGDIPYPDDKKLTGLRCIYLNWGANVRGGFEKHQTYPRKRRRNDAARHNRGRAKNGESRRLQR